MDEDIDWTGVIFGMGVLTLGTIIIIVVLLQIGSFSRARMARREHAQELAMIQKYETLADQSTEHQKASSAELTTIRERLDAIETLLREVE